MMEIFDSTLTKNCVSIQSEAYGTRAYANSTRGREQMEAECPTEIVQEVYEAWVDKPTITEPTLLEMPQSTLPSIEDRLKALETAQLSALGV